VKAFAGQPYSSGLGQAVTPTVDRLKLSTLVVRLVRCRKRRARLATEGLPAYLRHAA
jgi:hypothetical protein